MRVIDILHLISTAFLLLLAWDVHRGTTRIIAKTDERLRRVPPTA